jgi:hypothetical protein
MATESIKSPQAGRGAAGPEPAVEAMAAPAGDWPERASRKAVIITAVAWVAWVGFMIAMMIIRFKTTPI